MRLNDGDDSKDGCDDWKPRDQNCQHIQQNRKPAEEEDESGKHSDSKAAIVSLWYSMWINNHSNTTCMD